MSATVSEAKRGWRIAKTFLTAFFEHTQPQLAKRNEDGKCEQDAFNHVTSGSLLTVSVVCGLKGVF